MVRALFPLRAALIPDPCPLTPRSRDHSSQNLDLALKAIDRYEFEASKVHAAPLADVVHEYRCALGAVGQTALAPPAIV